MEFKYTKVYPYHKQPLCPICKEPISNDDKTNFNLMADPPILIFKCPKCYNEISISEKNAPTVVFKTEEMSSDISIERE